MGFFRAIADAARVANEDAHGARLLRDTQSTIACIENLEGEIQLRAMLGYLQILDRLMGEIDNWSTEGRIKVGRTMQEQARTTFDTDLAGSYAKWMAGAALESKERSSQKAQQAFFLLAAFTDYIRKTTGKRSQQGTGQLSNTSKVDTSAVNHALEKARMVLRIGIAMAQTNKKTIMNDVFALGYVFGCHDAALQEVGVTDQQECISDAVISYSIFWGHDEGPRLLREAVEHQHVPEFKRGVLAGGKDTLAHLRGEKYESRLFTHLQAKPDLKKISAGPKTRSGGRPTARKVVPAKSASKRRKPPSDHG